MAEVATVATEHEAAVTVLNTRTIHQYFYGFFFGYPPCCIHAFLTRDLVHWSPEWSGRADQIPLMGSGFVPCSECATSKSAEQLTEVIMSRRACSVPFPYPDEEQAKVDEEFKNFKRNAGMLIISDHVRAFLNASRPNSEESLAKIF